MQVIKRDGTEEEFNAEKIFKALTKAFEACGYEDTEHSIQHMISEMNFWDGITIEEIQDEVEETLSDYGYADVFKAYVTYRESHKQARFVQERLAYMTDYSKSSENAATSSETDANANITMKNVANLEAEVYKTTNRIIQRQRMKDQLKHDFPEVAKQYEEDLENHIIYAHDEASTPVPKHYCMAVSLYPFLEYGTSTMDGLKTTAPHNLNSFCGQFGNLVFLLSSQCKGAVGFAEFFNIMDYYCVKEWGEDYHNKGNLSATSDYTNNKKTISQQINQCFQQIVYTINQSASNRGYQSPFVNFNYFDSYYWHSLFGEFRFPDGSQPKWERVSYLQKKFMRWFNKERTKTLLTYPVESLCLLNDGKDYLDKEYKELAAKMWSEGHSFFVYTSDNADSVASCCRLRNDIKTFTSTTGLTGIEVGSCNVITLNMNRIIQNWVRSWHDYKDHIDSEGKCAFPLEWLRHDDFKANWKSYLNKILTRVLKYHIAYKNILYDWEARKMITACNSGYIHMNKLYSTYGINGINEMARFLGLEVSNNKDYYDWIAYTLGCIKEFIDNHNQKRYMLNLELVPAESLGVKNYNWDKSDNYWVPSDENLYNSYIYNAHDPNTSVLDRFYLQGGAIAEAVSGGQAVHCNLQDHLSKSQYLKLLDYAVKVGCNYFTFNIPNTQCDECGVIYKQPLTKCPKCGSEELTQWTRVNERPI
jgi:ribonucleoside-triphosphate reductase (formate)